MLRNLISNALKFTPRGGSVSVSASFVPNPEQNSLNNIVKNADGIDDRADGWTYEGREKDRMRGGHGKSRDYEEVINSQPRLQKSKDSFPHFLRNPSLISSNNKIHSSDNADNEDIETGPALSLRGANTKAYGASRNPSQKDAQRENMKNHRDRDGGLTDDINGYGGDFLFFSNQGGEQKNNSAGRFEALSHKITCISNKVDRRTIADNQKNNSSRKHPRNNDNISNSNDCDRTIIYGKLVIVVTDTGAGISEANLRRLFTEIVQFTPEKLQVRSRRFPSFITSFFVHFFSFHTPEVVDFRDFLFI